MARKSSGKAKSFGRSQMSSGHGSKINKIEKYEDTLEEGGVDDFMFKRDQIMFNEADESDEEDVNAGEGEEVFALKRSKAFQNNDEEDMDEEEEDEAYDAEPQTKGRKEKKKLDLIGKGRFGKAVVSSDEEEEESGSSDEDEEGWGRSYYARPSNRREKEDDGEYDEKREEEKEMEEREVRRLQRKAREGYTALDDWGLEELPPTTEDIPAESESAVKAVSVPLPQTTNPEALIKHMESHEPVKIALARDYPLVVQKLEKTAKGIQAMMAEKEGEESLHKGLGWLHYQTLLTYATTLAFYIHLCALPRDSRPDLSTHPILERLLQLKEGVSMLEDLDFAAGEGSDIDPLDGEEPTDEDKELAELMKAKRELMARMNIACGSGMDVMPEEGDDEEGEGEDEEEYDEDEDMQNLWHQAGLEDGELDGLLADAEEEEEFDLASRSKAKKEKKDKKTKRESGEKKKPRKTEDGSASTGKKAPQFAPLEEPAFVSSGKSKSRARAAQSEDDILGDPTALNEADATDKERRKRSLQFHTSKIASTSARRAAARASRLGGDEDLPYRDRQAARDAALRKNSQAAAREGEDLDGSEWSEKDKKRAREVREEDGDDQADDGDDYYDLVKRRKTDRDDAKAMAHEEYQAAKFSAFNDEDHEGGPRALTRAIEKNRGLTPRRSKTGRNPRVKKRQAYEKAKQKVGSQRAVFKGGQASLGGQYAGEKTGISQVVKSRKF